MQNDALTPAQIGERWVLPTIDLSVPSQVTIEASITVADPDELSPSDINVQVMADNNEPLTASSSPDPNDLLPVTELRGLTAHAYYTFDNSENRALTSIVVSVKGESATFTLDRNVA
jgi:hypothetical protein